MSNSPLVSYKRISPNRTPGRNHKIDRISVHCVVGQLSVETLGSVFAPSSRQASSNYGIGSDGRVGMYVEEKDRSWCTSSSHNDNRAVTIECASDAKHPYAFKPVVYNKLIDLYVDICKRNGKTKLLWISNKSKALNYEPKSNEMVLTVHRWYANKSCPGDWMYSRLDDLAKSVTDRLSKGTTAKPAAKPVTKQLYRVRKSWKDSKTQKGAFSSLDNAKALAKQHKGYKVYNSAGTVVYDPWATTKKKKTTTEVAKEIIKGTCSDPRWETWGTGKTRIDRLKAAGYDAGTVQRIVNSLMK